MELYLVRHAVAFERDPKRWPDDAERPLTPEGEERFREACAGLRRAAPAPALVLSSPAARAWRTAELLGLEAGWPAPERSEELSPGSSPQAAWRALQGRAASPIALVGHEPHLGELASYLLAGEPDAARLELKKGGVACLRLADGAAPGTAALRWLLTPELLRALQGG
jgi:phosphohistidine phosphatase